MEENWVKVKGFDKAYLAEIAKEVLADNEINSVIINKQSSSYLVFGEVEIYVSKENAVKAINCLKDLD
jgi:hypothetical protein